MPSPRLSLFTKQTTIMADNNKNYADYMDFPDGQGGTQRTYFRDADAQAAIAQLSPAEVASDQLCEDAADEIVFIPST